MWPAAGDRNLGQVQAEAGNDLVLPLLAGGRIRMLEIQPGFENELAVSLFGPRRLLRLEAVAEHRPQLGGGRRDGGGRGGPLERACASRRRRLGSGRARRRWEGRDATGNRLRLRDECV